MSDFFFEGTIFSTKFAIRLNNKVLLGDSTIENGILTFTTMKQAIEHVDYMKKVYPDYSFEIVEVEQEFYADTRKPVYKKKIRE